MSDDKIKIHVKVDGRVYPLRIKREDETLIRKAAKWADEEIAALKRRHEFEHEADAAIWILIKQIFEKLTLEEECKAFSEQIQRKSQEILNELDF